MGNASNLFDVLRSRFELKNDARLAEALGVAPPVICKTRQSGTASADLMLKIHERLGVPIAEIRQLSGQSAPQQYHDTPA